MWVKGYGCVSQLVGQLVAILRYAYQIRLVHYREAGAQADGRREEALARDYACLVVFEATDTGLLLFPTIVIIWGGGALPCSHACRRASGTACANSPAMWLNRAYGTHTAMLIHVPALHLQAASSLRSSCATSSCGTPPRAPTWSPAAGGARGRGSGEAAAGAAAAGGAAGEGVEARAGRGEDRGGVTGR